ncbi:MAG: DUF819 family protein [Candidatus Palauibacterales bacterium]|nr:DUF819 family protein [Candidatus Palauibacterales bacterium]
MITDPTALFIYLAVVLGLIFWASGQPRLAPFFKYTPAVMYAYFVPTFSTTLGITPMSSPTYDWMTRYLLPFSFMLLMVTVDVRAILRLGRMALIMMLTGTAGIIIGAPIALLLVGRWLPGDAWMGLAALSGSWIGGTANMVAIAESVGTPSALLGPIIVVDTVVGYGWMGVLLFLSAWQGRYDARVGADTAFIVDANRRLDLQESVKRPAELRDIVMILAVGFGGAYLCILAGEHLPTLGDPTIISHTTWAVVLVTTLGLTLSFTRLSRLEQVGASRIGYLALYLLLTAIGAQANLREVLAVPLYLGVGVIWISIHIGLLLLVGRLVRAPLFFVALGSMANVGGAVSAPVVASVYHPALAPVGLLMGVSGYIIGIYGGILCAWLLSLVGG